LQGDNGTSIGRIIQPVMATQYVGLNVSGLVPSRDEQVGAPPQDRLGP
jgi:hypothetical protein